MDGKTVSAVRPEARALLASSRGSVEAPAGCGKTELIADLVTANEGRRTLVLTHTNAGVDTLRKRIRAKGAPSSRYVVTTIDSMCVRYVSAYPATAGGFNPKADGKRYWPSAHAGFATLLEKRSFVREVIEASYDFLVVDEYQDCTTAQHAVVLLLAEWLPCIVFGDPLQAIFGFADDPLPSWNQVTHAFPPLMSLDTPHRWMKNGANAELGRWLLEELRTPFLRGQPVTLGTGTPIAWRPPGHYGPNTFREVCLEAVATRETVVGISKFGSNDLGKTTNGLLQSIEPIESKDGRKLCDEIEAGLTGSPIDVVKSIAVAVMTHGKDAVERLSPGKRPVKKLKPGEVLLRSSLALLAEQPSAGRMRDSLNALRHTEDVSLFRRELFWALYRSLGTWEHDGGRSLLEHFRLDRAQTSHAGRRLSTFCAGSTLLVKGMEFAHSVVFHDTTDRHVMGGRELYVALTRGCKTVTLIAASPIIQPP